MIYDTNFIENNSEIIFYKIDNQIFDWKINMKYFLNISGIFDADWDFLYTIIWTDFIFLEFQKIIFLES